MKRVRLKLGALCSALALAVAVIVPATLISTNVAAQEITASISATVLQPDGTVASGATASLVDSRDGRRQTSTADNRGSVNFRSVSPGGPYTIRISQQGYEDLVITDLYTDIAGTSEFTVTLTAADANLEEIVVTARQVETITTASGPSATYSLQEITDMPSTLRQIRDIIRVDPRISIGETGDGGDQSGAISCLGGSSRTNSFTVDGVRATDAFGLNLSGNLSRFTFPIPFDTVEAAAVEFSPVSVEYGQFSGCNVNVVTKSGQNEFHGGGFFLYNDDGMTGEDIDGVAFPQGTFERENYGFDIGGPIIKDKLFFYGAYEKFDTATVNPVGAADDTTFPRNDTVFTLAELNQIRDILSSQYGREPGEIVRNLPVESERVFVRFDWNINDQHRVEAAYSSVEEATTIGDDIGSGRGEFTFSDNFHARGSDSETLSFRLYSDWTDRLSTELRYSTQEVIDAQNPVGGGEAQDAVPRPRIAISPIFASEFAGTEFTSGPGTFRSANKLTTDKAQLKLKFDYQLGDHLITGGFENESLDVFNLFIINATGTFFFNDIAALQAGNAFEIISANSFTGDPNDAAAVFTRDINSFFLQDQWDINDDLQLIFGLRYDKYETDDLPLANPNYIARYGISNQVSFDGLDAVQPRIGLNYNLPEQFGDTRMSLGFGVFSGNDPTVWFSNAYQNFGGALGRATATGTAACDGTELDVLAGGGFSGAIPSCVLDAAQAQAQNISGTVNATDPNFELPKVNRYSFGLEHNTDFENSFLDGWNVTFDMIYADLQDQVDFLDLSLTQAGTAPDGRPTYTQINRTAAGCAATFNGPRMGYSNTGDLSDPLNPCLGGNQDVYFTNLPGDGGHTFTTSIQANKVFNWGDAWELNATLGYSFNESEIGNPGTSFTAAENFRAVVAEDINQVPVGPSLRNTPHNFVISTTFSNEFWSGYRTSLTAFFQRRKGSPLSAVFSGNFAGSIGDTGGRARSLLYVPTDASDPLVTFGPGFDTAGFFAFVDANGLARGQIQQKGGLDETWSTDLDIRIQQDIPFFGDINAKVYLDIENFLNLVNDDWGVKQYIDTTDIQSAVSIVDATIDPGTNTFLFNAFTPSATLPDTFDSLYRIQFGIRAEF